MICKLQVPLASNLPRNEWVALLYNQDRSYQIQMPITEEIAGLMQDRVRIYVDIMLTPLVAAGFVIKGEVPDPKWR